MVREVCEGLTFFFVSAKMIKKAKKRRTFPAGKLVNALIYIQ